jgi:hypothetical protein
VVLPDQGIEQLFVRRPSDLAQFDGGKIAQWGVIGDGGKNLTLVGIFFLLTS